MVKQFGTLSVFPILLLALTFCNPVKEEGKQSIKSPERELEIKHAKGFSITYHEGYKKVIVNNPWKNANQSFTYLLLDRNAESLPETEYDALVKVPVETLVCTSTSHLPMLEMIGVGDRLKGFPNTKLISSFYFVRQAELGELTDLGPDQNMNMERLLDLDPEMLMAYSTGTEINQFDLVKRSDIPMVLNGDYMESTPLGRAEWIKFVAAFFNKEDKADSIFRSIATKYDSLSNLARNVQISPTVLTGIMYGDTWFLPGGKNYSAQFFEDAGAHYIWHENPEDGWLEFSFETVLDEAQEAEFWVGVASFDSRSEMEAADHRYGSFQAMSNSKVFNYNAKLGPNGGNAYLELGYSRPDLVLSDLIKIFHPEILPGYDMVFYKQIL